MYQLTVCPSACASTESQSPESSRCSALVDDCDVQAVTMSAAVVSTTAESRRRSVEDLTSTLLQLVGVLERDVTGSAKEVHTHRDALDGSDRD